MMDEYVIAVTIGDVPTNENGEVAEQAAPFIDLINFFSDVARVDEVKEIADSIVAEGAVAINATTSLAGDAADDFADNINSKRSPSFLPSFVSVLMAVCFSY